MILKRVIMPLFVVGIILGLSSVAHAQVTCQTTSTPATRASSTGHTEVTGDYTISCTSPAGATGTTVNVLQVDYGVPITSNAAHPPGRPLSITCTNSGFSAPLTCPGGVAGVNVTLVTGFMQGAGIFSNAAGTLQLQFPNGGFGTCTPVVGATCSLTIKIQGVLVSLAGTGKTTLAATTSIATPGNGMFMSGAADTSTVISTVLPGIKDPTINTTIGAGSVTAFGTSFHPAFGIDITENYVDMFRGADQFNCAGPSQPGISAPVCAPGAFAGVFPQAPGSTTSLRVQFNNIPTGVTISGCSATATKADGSASSFAPLLSSTSVDATNPTITIAMTGSGDPTQIETVTFTCTTITVNPANVPLSGGSITVQVTLAPTGTSTNSTSITAGQVPRYASTLQPTTALTVITVVPSTTNLLVPFAVAGGGFDTGIVVSNTTADTFGTTTGGAIPQNGTVTYTFFPNGGSSFSFTTGAAGTPTGNGGLTSGSLNAGNSYSVLLSELLKAAGKGPAFSGYIFINTNFTNAHGVAFAVSNFDGKFTSYSPMLVLPPPAGTPRTAGAAEQLDQ